jgi:hypothetical protein
MKRLGAGWIKKLTCPGQHDILHQSKTSGFQNSLELDKLVERS